MKKIYLILVTNVILNFFSFCYAQTLITDVDRNGSSINLYKKFELTITLSKSYSNPYNPSEINLRCKFVSPSGKVYYQPGFYYNVVNRTIRPAQTGDKFYEKAPGVYYNIDEIHESSTNYWKVRFAPDEPGYWYYTVIATDNTGTEYYPQSYFGCENLDAKGYIKVANKNFLKFENNEPFYPIGLNLSEYKQSNILNQEVPGLVQMYDLMDLYSGNGINYFRYTLNTLGGVNIMAYDMYSGINYFNKYNQIDSWRMDQIMEYAEQKDIYIALTIFNHANFGDGGYAPEYWQNYNPFNKDVTHQPTDGQLGDCETPWDFYRYNNTNTRTHIQNYIRYIIARWGYSPNIVAWEIMGEGNNFKGFDVPDDFLSIMNTWYTNVYNYIKNIDYNRHLVYSSFTGIDYANLSDILDLYTYHSYGAYNTAGNMEDHQNNMFVTIQDKDLQKPLIIDEFGYLDNGGVVYSLFDPNLYDVHNSLWSTMFSGALSPGCFWDWRAIHPISEYPFNNFVGISNFVKELPMYAEDYTPTKQYNDDYRAYYLKNNTGESFVGWLQDNNFMFKNIWDYYRPYLIDFDPNDRPSNASNKTFNITVGRSNTKYELKLYNTETGNIKYRNIVTSNSNKIIPISTLKTYGETTNYLSNNYADLAFKLSCKPSIGWVENQTCPGQWHQVTTYSDLVFNTSANKLFYINDDKLISQLYKNGVTWGDASMSTTAKKAYNGKGLVYNKIDDAIYYVGEDAKIYKTYLENGVWKNIKACPGQWHNVRSDSKLVTNVSGSHIYYVSTNNRVCALYKIGSSWGDCDLNTTGTKCINGRSVLHNQLDDNIYYVGTDYKIYQLKIVNGSWVSTKACPGQWHNVRSDSELETNYSGGNIYYVASNGKMCYLNASGSSWGDCDMNTSAQSVKYWSNFNIDKATNIIYYIGSDNSLYKQQVVSNSWRFYPLTQSGYCQEEAGYSIVYANSHIYYTGQDNKIHDFYYESQLKSTEDENIINIDGSIKDVESQTFLANEKPFLIYPNPVSSTNEITIELSDDLIEPIIYIYNVNGTMIESYKPESRYFITTLNLKTGIYFIKINSQGSTYNQKLIVSE